MEAQCHFLKTSLTLPGKEQTEDANALDVALNTPEEDVIGC
jgi:hypothetical protein